MPYGSTDDIKTRTGVAPSDLGFDGGDQTTAEDQLDAFIEGLREKASSLVEEYTDRVFDLVEKHVDVLYGNGRETISTRNYPVATIHSISVGNSTLDESDYRLDEHRDGRNSGRIERVGRGARWPRGREIEITYNWGYSSTPPAVDKVVEDMVVEVLNNAVADRERDGKSSESMDGYSASWSVQDAQQELTLTESMQRKLDSFKRMGMA